MIRRTLCLVIIGTYLGGLIDARVGAEEAELAVPKALFNYVQREEKVFEWKLNGRQETGAGVVYDVALTSQQWQGIVWKHSLQVYEPTELKHPGHVLLFVTGGSTGGRPGPEDIQRGLILSKLCGARVAAIHQVPNQPLFDGRKEDDLITDTWLRYLETGDETWPLLFPMVKSAVKAMDAIEELAAAEWKTPVEGFVITGASKRGWTSWLTAVADQRVIATAPMVIDVLNFRPQMRHQLDAWGKYSEQIVDYTSKGLIKEGDETPRDTQLRLMMDPYTYRKQLTLPKLLINGTNDRYWVADAMSLYWDDLVGPKYVLQVPNAGHGLDGGHELVLSTIAAFFRHAVTKTPLPQLQWEHSDSGNDLSLTVTSTAQPKAARLWVAHSDTSDFRESKWQSQELDGNSDSYVGSLTKPQQGHVAYYCELRFEYQGLPYSLCTVIRCE
ncbi:MAG: PhoPQ-activated protein PqaA family protein [Planctomycetota bacterium]|nr:PhoPQ-activated protein PqaA family protein [Planctomycetota bacterium]